MDLNLFIKQLTHLPFKDVISYCSLNKQYRNYCLDPKYNNIWKNLIDNAYGYIYNYKDYLSKIWNDPSYNYGSNTYNYLVYTKLINILDPITQLMIYYKQRDMKSFNDDNRFNKKKRFLALFLLGDKNRMKDYLPSPSYQPFIDSLKGKEISKFVIDDMMVEMAKEGNVLGVKYLVEKGANINYRRDLAVRLVSLKGHLEVVKYLVEKGADIYRHNSYVLMLASENGHLEVVKYLVEKGANIHANSDEALRFASQCGHLEVVKYLVEKGADIHAENDGALTLASGDGHVEVVKYLKSLYPCS